MDGKTRFSLCKRPQPGLLSSRRHTPRPLVVQHQPGAPGADPHRRAQGRRLPATGRVGEQDRVRSQPHRANVLGVDGLRRAVARGLHDAPPDPAALAAFRDQEPPQDGEATVRGAWTLHDAAGHWIMGSDHPVSIPDIDGERVVVLDPLTMHTRFSAGRAFLMVHAHVEVLAELPAQEARLQLDRTAPPRDP
jgi:hypothetical protein